MTKRETDYHTHTVDGISYSITIEPCGRGTFVGNWQCLTCHIGGGSSSTFGSRDETLVHAKINLAGHHGNTHKK